MNDDKPTHDIFISYSRKNKDAVLLIKGEIERTLGLRCWMDLEGIESGSREFTQDIIDAIDTSTAFLFFLTTSSQESKWALKEIDYAISENKHVVLVRFNSDPMTKRFRFDFGRTDVIDWRVPEQKEKLLRDMKFWSGSGDRSQDSPSGAASALVICPVCGKKNDPKDTFKCRKCGRDNICLRHQDEKTFRCVDCMSKVRKEKPSFSESHVKPPATTLPAADAPGGASRAGQIVTFCEKERAMASWSDLYVGDGIPTEKLANFRTSAASRCQDKKGILLADPIALCDATVFGSAKNGFLLTEKGIAVSGDWAANTSASYLSWEEFVSPAGTVLFEGGYEILLYTAHGQSVFFNAAACGRNVQDVVVFFRRLREIAGAKPASSSPAIQIVAKAFANVCSDRFWIGEKIPPAKERNARKSMNIGKQTIFALYDDTVWGGSREGFAVVASGLFFKNIAEDPVFIPWTDMGTISAVEGALFVGTNKIECADSSLDSSAKQAVVAGLRLLVEQRATLSEGGSPLP